MKTYLFSFHGRQSGAIGIYYDIKQDYKCESLEEAVSKLWYDYDVHHGLN